MAGGDAPSKTCWTFCPATRSSGVRASTQEVEAAEIKVGDVVVVKPGSRLPVDGEVVAGNSFVDQSAITGESMPVEKLPGTSVYAGTINQSGVLEVRTTGIGRDTAFGKIIEAVERAEKSRAPIQKTADRLAGYLVYFAIGCAVLTFLVTRDMRSTISVVIVAGACGIAAGTPLAILGAIGRAARQGAIIKGGLYLEVLGTVDTIVLDKTGTLTLGNPKVSGVCPCPDVAPEAVVEAAALAERPSEHPLAKAILEKAAEMSLAVTEPERFEYVPGKGIVCWLGGEQIVVGNRGFLEQHRIDTGCPGRRPRPLLRSAGGTERTAPGVAPHRGRFAARVRASGGRAAQDGAADGPPDREMRRPSPRPSASGWVSTRSRPSFCLTEKVARIEALMADGEEGRHDRRRHQRRPGIDPGERRRGDGVGDGRGP